MTLKIDLFFENHGTRIRLSGELRCEQLGELRTEIERASHRVTLDLAGVDLVDINAVWFLNDCEAQRIKLINCAPYIREWMFRERAGERNSERS